MKAILVTGSAGFIRKHLCLALKRQGGFGVVEFDRDDAPAALPKLVARADLVFHLAGVSRPQDESEFLVDNVELTQTLCQAATEAGRPLPIIFSSSTQATGETPYGISKRAAEAALGGYARTTGASVAVFRLPNVFGKWSRPNYNSVVATFCHQVNRGFPVAVNDHRAPVTLVHIDDVVRALLDLAVNGPPAGYSLQEVRPVQETTVGALHDLIVSFREARTRFVVPDLGDPFRRALHSTFMSFLPVDEVAQPVRLQVDERGWLFELLKSPTAGQVFVTRTLPGVTRGNHSHDTKIEKCCVVAGSGVLRLHPVLGGEVFSYALDDRALRVVDIPPGFVHSLENTGTTDLITLFWAGDIFDPAHPDTWRGEVSI